MMTDEEVLDAIVLAVREETDNPAAVVTPATKANHIAGWDSLAHARIIINIGLRLGIEIDIDATYKAGDVGALIAIVQSMVPNAP